MPLALENSWEHVAYAVDSAATAAYVAATAAYEAAFSAVEATFSAAEAALGLGLAPHAGKAQTQPAAGTEFTQFTCFF
jgi:hypothetical protein